MVAFMDNRTWRQKELAEHVGVETRALVRRLKELQTAGMQLKRDEEPPDVYWSVPRGWFPQGVLLEGERLQRVVRLLARLRRSAERERALAHLLASELPDEVNPEPALVRDEVLTRVEDAWRSRRALEIRYRSAQADAAQDRIVSPAALRLLDERPQMLAWCHMHQEPRVFRLDCIEVAHVSQAAFHPVAQQEIERWRLHSVEGFIASGPLVPCWFEVKLPEGRWVPRNLPDGAEFEVQEREGAVRVSCSTGALKPLARFVTGLGELLVGCSEELGREVSRQATAALACVGAPNSTTQERRSG